MKVEQLYTVLNWVSVTALGVAAGVKVVAGVIKLVAGVQVVAGDLDNYSIHVLI